MNFARMSQEHARVRIFLPAGLRTLRIMRNFAPQKVYANNNDNHNILATPLPNNRK